MNEPSAFDILCKQVAIEAGNRITPKTVAKVLKALYRIYLRQLEVNGIFKMPKFGIFKISVKEEKEMKVGDPVNGGYQYIYVPEERSLTFSESKYLHRAINSDFKPVYKKVESVENEKRKYERLYDPTMKETVSYLFDKADKKKGRN